MNTKVAVLSVVAVLLLIGGWLVSLGPPVEAPPIASDPRREAATNGAGEAPGEADPELGPDRVVEATADSSSVERRVVTTAGEEESLSVDRAAPGEAGRTASLLGRVSVNGAPAVGFDVVAYSGDWLEEFGDRRAGLEPVFLGPGRSSRTDEAGRFALRRIPLGPKGLVDLAIGPSGTEGQSQFRTLRLRPGEDREVRLEFTAGSLPGEVRTAAGAVVPFVDVTVHPLPRAADATNLGGGDWGRHGLEEAVGREVKEGVVGQFLLQS